MRTGSKKTIEERICEIDGVESAKIDEKEPLLHVKLRQDSETTVEKVRAVLRNHHTFPPLFPRFVFPDEEGFAVKPSVFIESNESST